MVRRAALAACIVVFVAQAHAQTGPTDAEKNLVGDWELSNAERDQRCAATFSTDKATGGFKVQLEATCAQAFPPLKDVAAWKYPDNDLLRLVDGKGKTLVEFSEVESGIFEAPTPGIGVLFLQKPGDVGAPPKPPEEVAGDYALTRGGKTLCMLTLTTAPADDGMTLSAKPGCDPAIVRQGFSKWRVDRDELMLTPARGNPWRFETDDGKTWDRVPEGANPYQLVKQ
jgi:Protease inhibitor Inh